MRGRPSRPLLAAMIVSIACLLCATRTARAQEFSVMSGVMEPVDATDWSYSWAIEYRQSVGRNIAWSATWLNEGHPDQHHRDGIAAQGWWWTDIVPARLTLGLGAGFYHYFDTVRVEGDGYRNEHGTGALYSLSVSYYTHGRWLGRVVINRADAGHYNTNSIVAGIGYQLWRAAHDEPPAGTPPGEPPPEKTTSQELMAFVGRTVINSFSSEKLNASGLEYRRGVRDYVDWSVSYFHEKSQGTERRNGLASQAWLTRGFKGGRLALGIGGGAFVRLDRRVVPDGSRSHTIDGLVTLTAAYRPSTRWYVRLNWNRLVTADSRDADIFVVGAGVRWGETS